MGIHPAAERYIFVRNNRTRQIHNGARFEQQNGRQPGRFNMYCNKGVCMKKAAIFAPFWRQAGHVGNLRVDRFARWLAEDGFHVVMIRAGSVDGRREESWGTEITVRDPMGLYRDASRTGVHPLARKPNKLRRNLSYWLFNPDPGVVWASKAARHPSVLEAAAGADFILSSSPPESAHVGAWKLSRRLGLPHIVDMRDGWMDEPLKPLLRTSAFRRWQEGRLEARILHDAGAIQVTSDVWQELLCKRMPELASKAIVLTNGYPPTIPELVRTERARHDSGLVLVHAGKFFGSMLTRSPDLLLAPLLQVISQSQQQGTVRLIGSLSDDDHTIIARFEAPFLEHGWRIECTGNIPRDELFRLLPQADGLLLLAEKFAAIPCKLFEYIPTGRPILVVTNRNSATWRICEKLPQAVLVDCDAPQKIAEVEFLKILTNCDLSSVVPEEFCEARLKDILLRSLKCITR